MLSEKVGTFIRENRLFEKGDAVTVAFSGGPDSMALLVILNELKDDFGIALSATHINHGLRGKESEDDEAFAIETARKLSLALHVKRINVGKFRKEWGGSIQSASRELRYKVFSHLVQTGVINKVVTGHTADDSVETVLMNILRGTGIHGLSGIQAVRDGYILRPFINIWKSEILEFLEDKQIAFRVDSSNFSMKYTRNSIREDLLPLLQTYNPEIKRSIKRSSSVMSDLRNFLMKAGREGFEKTCLESLPGKSIILDCEKLRDMDRAVQMEIIRYSVELATGGGAEISFDHFEEVLKLALGNDSGETHIHGIKGIKSSNRLYLKNSQVASVPGYSYDFISKGDIQINETGSIVHVEPVPASDLVFDHSCKRIFIDADALPKDAVIRNRREGDSFRPMGFDGIQKLKKFFINNKIPRWEREKLPLLVSGKRVLWIPGYRLSEDLRIREGTRNILCIDYRD